MPSNSPEPTGDAVARFKVVADALGFDGAGMLERFAQTWLDAISSAWRRSLSEASSPDPTVKQRRSAPAPVRLHSATADARQAVKAVSSP
jgi:hypothetical protein